MTQRIDDNELANISGGGDGTEEVAQNPTVTGPGSGKSGSPPGSGGSAGGVDPDHDASGSDVGELGN